MHPFTSLPITRIFGYTLDLKKHGQKELNLFQITNFGEVRHRTNLLGEFVSRRIWFKKELAHQK